MRRTFFFAHIGPCGLCAMVAVLMCAGVRGARAADKKTAAAATAITIPKDAVANPDGTSYTWTDKDGKKWIFAKTPFGIMKTAATEHSADKVVSAGMKVTDNGDTVRFERPSPFGTVKWEKKKSDLTDEERRMLDAQSAKPAPAQSPNAEQK